MNALEKYVGVEKKDMTENKNRKKRIIKTKEAVQGLNTNRKKELCQLYFQEKIWQLHSKGKSLQKITKYLNNQCIPHSRFKDIIISKTTVWNIIKKKEEK